MRPQEKDLDHVEFKNGYQEILMRQDLFITDGKNALDIFGGNAAEQKPRSSWRRREWP